MGQFFQIHPEPQEKRLIDKAVPVNLAGRRDRLPDRSRLCTGLPPGRRRKPSSASSVCVNSMTSTTSPTMCSDLYRKSAPTPRWTMPSSGCSRATRPEPSPSSSRPPKCHACCCIPSVAPSACACGTMPVAHALLEAHHEPLMSVTLIPPGEELPMSATGRDPSALRACAGSDGLDGGACRWRPPAWWTCATCRPSSCAKDEATSRTWLSEARRMTRVARCS